MQASNLKWWQLRCLIFSHGLSVRALSERPDLDALACEARAEYTQLVCRNHKNPLYALANALRARALWPCVERMHQAQSARILGHLH